MVVIVKRNTPRKQLKALLRKAKATPVKGKGLDARKHLGTVKLKQDPVTIQRRLRDEWD
jgi:tripartite-type tricarboxylate transporter receptor subunit TctC